MRHSFLSLFYFLFICNNVIANKKYLLIKLSEVSSDDVQVPDSADSQRFQSTNYDYAGNEFNEWNCKDGDECQKLFGLQGVASVKEMFCEKSEEYRNKCPVTCGFCEGIGCKNLTL